MSALQWRDWSCTVRIVLADGRPATERPDGPLATGVEAMVRDLMDDVARSASRFRADSDLSRINAAAGSAQPVRRLTLDLVVSREDVGEDAAWTVVRLELGLA